MIENEKKKSHEKSKNQAAPLYFELLKEFDDKKNSFFFNFHVIFKFLQN